MNTSDTQNKPDPKTPVPEGGKFAFLSNECAVCGKEYGKHSAKKRECPGEHGSDWRTTIFTPAPSRPSAGDGEATNFPVVCDKCGDKGWILHGHGNDEQCDCVFVDPPESPPTPENGAGTGTAECDELHLARIKWGELPNETDHDRLDRMVKQHQSWQSKACELEHQRNALETRLAEAQGEHAELWAECNGLRDVLKISETARHLAEARCEELMQRWNNLDTKHSELAEKHRLAEADAAQMRNMVERLLPLAEIGWLLTQKHSFSDGDGYTGPHEYSIQWEWVQSKPGEYGYKELQDEARNFVMNEEYPEGMNRACFDAIQYLASTTSGSELLRERDRLKADHDSAMETAHAFRTERDDLRTQLEAVTKERDWERAEWPKQIAEALDTDVRDTGRTPSMLAGCVAKVLTERDEARAQLAEAQKKTTLAENRLVWATSAAREATRAYSGQGHVCDFRNALQSVLDKTKAVDCSELTAATTAADSMAKDKERLDWLSEYFSIDDVGDESYVPGMCIVYEKLMDDLTWGPNIEGRCELLTNKESTLRSAIDAALAAHANGGGL